MSQYKHLSYCERVELARMVHQGASKAAMAEQFGRPRSSIEREIARNGNKDSTYNADTAQRRYEARRRRGSILDRVLQLQEFVVDQLHEKYFRFGDIAEPQGRIYGRRVAARRICHG